MKKLTSITLATFLVLLVCSSFALGAKVNVGDEVPELTLEMMSGKKVNVSELAKKNDTMIITFIQTACTACRGEIVELQKLHNENDKILILPISVDMRGGVEFLEKYKKENSINFDFGIDPKFIVGKTFGMSFTPGTILIKKGKVAEILPGYDDAIKAKIEDMFK